MDDINLVLKPFIDIVASNPAVIEDMTLAAFAEQDGDFTIEAIREALEGSLRIEPTVSRVEPKKAVRMPSIKVHGGIVSRRQSERIMTYKTKILKIVNNHPNGIYKTRILNMFRKDNSHWRPIFTRWLYEMVFDGNIQEDENLFYPLSKVISMEKEVHLRIWETLSEGPKRFTDIANSIGYGGGGRRKKVQQALLDFEKIGRIEYKNGYWGWLNEGRRC